MTVNLDDGGVDHGVFHVRFVRHSIEPPLEDVRRGPVAVTFEDRVPLAKQSRQVAPWAAIRTIYSTASAKRRLSLPLRPGSIGLPRQCGSIFAHWASVSTKRTIASLNHNQASSGIPSLNRP